MRFAFAHSRHPVVLLPSLIGPFQHWHALTIQNHSNLQPDFTVVLVGDKTFMAPVSRLKNPWGFWKYELLGLVHVSQGCPQIQLDHRFSDYLSVATSSTINSAPHVFWGFGKFALRSLRIFSETLAALGSQLLLRGSETSATCPTTELLKILDVFEKQNEARGIGMGSNTEIDDRWRRRQEENYGLESR